MERTRHLSMSAEEKKGLQRVDFTKRLQGLLQQYADGAIALEKLPDRIDALKAQLKIDDSQAVLKAIAARLDPEKDNQRWLALLTDIAPAAYEPLATAIEDFQKEKADLLLKGTEKRGHFLASEHGIKGTAVVPNPAADAVFLEQLAALKQKTRNRVDDLARQST